MGNKKTLTLAETIQKAVDKHNKRARENAELFEKIAKGRKQIDIMELVQKDGREKNEN